jgi:hypothetical protein
MCLRLLGSDRDGEVLAAVHSLRRMLKAHDEDLHDLAARIEKPGLTDDEMRKIFNAGVEAGLERAEQERRAPNYFRDVGDAERWHEIATYCLQNPKRRHLYSREPGFLEGVVDRTTDGDVPSERQQAWLLKIYRRLGGK